MTDWPIVSVADVSSVITKGTTPTTLGARFQDHGVNFVKVEALDSGRIDHHRLAYIDDDTHTLLKRSVLQENDVLFSIAGTIGRTARVEATDLPANTNQAIAIIRPNLKTVDRDFLFYCLNDTRRVATAQSRVVQSVQQNLSLAELGNVEIPLPTIDEQRQIAATLGALDDKIESNRKQRALLRELGQSKVQASLGSGSIDVRLVDLVASIARGVAPKYADDDPNAPCVINQKCIRNGWVSSAPARRMVARSVAPEKKGTSGDVFVNSTGTGTLGRVGRWHSGDVFVDGHVTIVRPNPEVVSPTVLAYALFGRESDIEAMATGSTGQTELSASRLGDLLVSVPDRAGSGQLEAELLGFEDRISSLFLEEETLSRLRDALLPELLAGRIRVPEAAELAEATA